MLLCASCTPLHQRKQAATARPPALNREFRGVWVATVGNIDWPSKPGLSAQQQKQEAIAILDKLAELHMNVAILQVRTACDALYQSKLEPWSAVLTGHEGQSPGYDPLQFWITEAHRRGIELHAWINPFRARPSSATYTNSPEHVSNSHPDWVVNYSDNKDTLLWLDPGNPQAMKHVYDVVMDIVRRYDIDGIHIDDYFYPYPLHDKTGNVISFPDGQSYARYWEHGGRLKLDDWRRHNITEFIHHIYRDIHSEKNWVKFGVSPFGIWRPGHPADVAGFDAYASIYCDTRLWLHKGWLDYLVPQLYWKISAEKQNFLSLLEWWAGENHMHRTLCAGLYTGRLDGKGWCPDEIGDQIGVVRAVGADGEVHFSAKVLMKNWQHIDQLLIGKNGLYDRQAVVPASPWLDSATPAQPTATVRSGSAHSILQVQWQNASKLPVSQWAVQTRSGSKWTLHLYPGSATQASIEQDSDSPSISEIAVRAISRYGIASSPVIVQVNQ